MKLTTKQLKQIIREELEEVYYNSRGNHELYDDASSHIGERVWVHTERTSKNQGKNGMIGVYRATDKGTKTGNPYFKTNAIALEDCKFFGSAYGARKFKETGKRFLVAGISGIVSEWNDHEQDWNTFNIHNPRDPEGQEITYDPTLGYFFLVNDADKKEIKEADAIFFIASEQGEWYVSAVNPKFDNYD